jgi:Kef-type K+ transport system membrane component KefB
MSVIVGKYSIACRFICSVLVVAPLIYRITIVDGDAYHFLGLVLLAPLAGLALLFNSLFCLFRYRTWQAAGVSIALIPVSVIGFIVAWHYLPQFRM